MLAQKSILLLSLKKLKQRIEIVSEEELTEKAAYDKWSKKEIIGHLIDSAAANIRRFNEVQFSATPYTVEKYQQELLVRSNRYQEIPIKDLISQLTVLNIHISFMIEHCLIPFTEISIDGGSATLGFLVEDYVSHFIHHVNQI